MTIKNFSFEQDMEGQSVTPPLRITLKHEFGNIIFEAKRSSEPYICTNAKEGGFYEGLWETDAVELFLVNQQGHYEEWNLSPNGAWWRCRFSAKRKRDGQPEQGQGITSQAKISKHEWQAKLIIPQSQLLSNGKWQELRCNITAILGKKHRQHLSLAPLKGIEPDFHQPEAFLPISLNR